MAQHVDTYLQQRRALGFELKSQGYLLRKFAEYLDHSGHRGPLTTEVMLRWVNLPETLSRNYRARRLSAVRCFARYLAVRDGQTEAPGLQLVARTSFHQRPHLYSQQDLQQLLAAAGRLWPTHPLRRLTFQTLLGLLACTGLRISEALRLDAAHVDLTHGVLRIEKTKFKKSRLVSLHPTATRALRRYAQARYGQGASLDGSPFFVGGDGNRLTYGAVNSTFQRLRGMLGWKEGNGQWPRPRIHDLRHTFACQRLLSWYRQGKNVHHLVAALSTYMGHGKVTDTYWYLTATPELMAIAADRFEQFVGAGRGGQP
jgi:integrase